jgi:hypothetical protein
MLIPVALAGCADPYAEVPEKPAAPIHGELPAPQVPQNEPVSTTPAPSPEAAVRRAVELTANWTAETIARQHERFAAASTGAARRDAQRIAAQATTDPQLRAPGAKSIAILHAVVPRGGGAHRRLLVITHETVVGDGLRQARFRVTLAEAQQVGEGWVLSRWEPQP